MSFERDLVRRAIARENDSVRLVRFVPKDGKLSLGDVKLTEPELNLPPQ